MKKATIQLETLVCPSCVQKIETAIKSFDGVITDSVKVLFNSSKAKFEFDDEMSDLKDINKSITSLGFEVIKSQAK